MPLLTVVPAVADAAEPDQAPVTLTNSVVSLDQVRGFLNGTVPAAALPSPTWGPIGETVLTRTYLRDINVPAQIAA